MICFAKLEPFRSLTAPHLMVKPHEAGSEGSPGFLNGIDSPVPRPICDGMLGIKPDLSDTL
jgi:hypothetical protein